MKASFVIAILYIFVSGIQCHSPRYNPNLKQSNIESGYKCIHDEAMKTMPARKVVPQNYATLNRERGVDPNAYKNIRILYDTSRLDLNMDKNGTTAYTCYNAGDVIKIAGNSSYTCSSDDVLDAQKINYIKTFLLDYAERRLESALKVIPVSGPLKLSTLTGAGCYISSLAPIPIPQSYVDTGAANTDLVIFVTARPIATEGVLAVAGDCLSDENGRSIAGFINFDPAVLTPGDARNQRQQNGTALHESTHVLGFTTYKFGSFRNETNGTIAYDKIVQIVSKGSYNITRVITPRVAKAVQEHFDCYDPALNGAELENGGSAGTAGSHWEKRIFMGEYMIGSASVSPAFSKLTLALLEDSGWYKADYTQADVLFWGLNQGCDFALKSCEEWPSTYYCSQGELTCTPDRRAKGICNANSYTGLPAAFTYSDNSNDMLADYCPYYVPLPTDPKTGQDGWCMDPSNKPEDVVFENGETYCSVNDDTCRCFISNLAKDVSTGYNTDFQGCYKTLCTGPNRLKIQVGDYWYNCPFGGELQADQFGGTIQCPEDNGICTGTIVDPNWPEFLSIDPVKGEPGTAITISGYSFTPNMSINIQEDLTDCEFISSIMYKCRMPDGSHFRNPRHLLAEKVSVIMVDTSGRSTVGYEAFTLQVKLNSDYIFQTLDWLATYPLITAAISVGILLTLLLCCYCCYRERKKALYGSYDGKQEDNGLD